MLNQPGDPQTSHFRLFTGEHVNGWPGEEYLDSVEGWVSPDIIAALPAIEDFQCSRSVRGGALEIGVHHGRVLHTAAPGRGEGETSFAVDLFEGNILNADRSGHGSGKC